jgi:membrane protein implicated in regulation of membrane protease activity
MVEDRFREALRRVIISSLLMWLAIHGAQSLETPGAEMLTGSLMIAGLTALPLLLLWPWFRDWLRHERHRRPPRAERRYQALVGVEIVALCAMLIVLLMFFRA